MRSDECGKRRSHAEGKAASPRLTPARVDGLTLGDSHRASVRAADAVSASPWLFDSQPHQAKIPTFADADADASQSGPVRPPFRVARRLLGDMDITDRLSRIEINLERISTQIPSFEITDRDIDANTCRCLPARSPT